MTTPSSSKQSTQPKYCYLDLNINQWRQKLALATSFVHATDTRYGFSSKDIRDLGGSEISRIHDFMKLDHEWSTRATELKFDPTYVRPPSYGGRIVIELFWDIAPLACENFAKLCDHTCMNVVLAAAVTDGNKRKIPPVPIGDCGKPLTYKGSIFHRVVPNFIMQGGDFVFGNGSGGESALGTGKRSFKDERGGLMKKHIQRGTVGMGNSGKNSNTSQFYFTFQSKTPQCDGKHVVFGQVVSGFQVMDAVEQLGTKDGSPQQTIEITDCGIYHPYQTSVGESAAFTPGQGYWLDVPSSTNDDAGCSISSSNDTFSGTTAVFMSRLRIALIVPNQLVYDKFQTSLGSSVACEVQCFMEDSNNDSNKTDENVCRIFDGQGDRVLERSKLVEYFQINRPSIDLIVRAPVCMSMLEFNTTSENGAIKDIVVVTKPADSLKNIYQSIWVQIMINKYGWNLDGNNQ